jgi:hypothetical protein
VRSFFAELSKLGVHTNSKNDSAGLMPDDSTWYYPEQGPRGLARVFVLFGCSAHAGYDVMIGILAEWVRSGFRSAGLS